MAISRNHTIVPTRDQGVSAAFLADVLGIPVGKPLRPFVSVSVSSVSLDYADIAFARGTEVVEHHYEFEVDEANLRPRRSSGTAVLRRTTRADRLSEINTSRGDRAISFDDPDCHVTEVTTAPQH